MFMNAVQLRDRVNGGATKKSKNAAGCNSTAAGRNHMHLAGSSYGDYASFHAYVGNDPMNNRDPSGMKNCAVADATCIETPESAEMPGEPPPVPPGTQETDEIVVTGQRTRKTSSGGKIDFAGTREQFFAVTATSMEERPLAQKDISCGAGGGSVTVGRPAPLGAGESAAHSHTNSHSSVPGSGDNNFGNRSTGYMITSSRAYAIDRSSNGTYRTRIIAGSPLNTSETAELVGNMRNWESGNSSNKSRSDKQRFCGR